ncbi:MAG: cytochrome c [Dehalococcoidia bacterium]|nr:MAG: cytochrome c [Dehalococcoidia bacterium]
MPNPIGRAGWEERLSKWGAAATYVGVVSVVGLMLVAILLRSPDTRSNFQATSAGYDRSPLAVFGRLDPYPPISHDRGSTGESVYFASGCAGCHGLRGEGGIAGPPVWTLSLKTMTGAIRDGAPAVMPAFGPDQISDAQIGQIVDFLKQQRAAAPNDPGRKPAKASQRAGTSEKAP